MSKYVTDYVAEMKHTAPLEPRPQRKKVVKCRLCGRRVRRNTGADLCSLHQNA